MASESAPRLFLIDTFGLIFRAYYGRARAAVPSMRTSKGVPTEAVYVFTNMLRRLIRDQKPDYVAAVWEGEGPTFRDEEFPEYKANRDETPDDLLTQMPLIEKLLQATNTPILKQDGYEADDSIGSLARQAAEHDVDVFVISSDKDLMQLVDERVWFLNPMKNDQVYDADGVKEFMGVEPKQVIDLLALKGDSVDNIPGAPGIGDKGAKMLIEEYGSVEGAMEHAEEVKRKAYRESLQNHRDQILLSKRLATIAVDAPIPLELEKLAVAEPDLEALQALYTELEFHSLLSELDVPVEQKETESRTLAADEFAAWIGDRIAAQTADPLTVTVDFEPAEEIYAGGIAFCAEEAEAVLLPTADVEAARTFLEDPEKPKRVHDSKTAIHALRGKGIELRGVVEDTMLAAFLADSSRTDYSFPKTIARRMSIQADSDPCRAADLTRALGEALAEDVQSLEVEDVYRKIELPLMPVLADMEDAGIEVDPEQLSLLSTELGVEIDGLESDVHQIAGREFNLGSPKQIGEVLYDELGLPAPPRRGKTKSRSTAADVLEGLAVEHPIARKILDHRELTKLRSTYIDKLPELIRESTGRIHTTFNPTGSATGRLSSSDPNLQNIPVRTELGRRIRAAFVAPEGKTLLAADYSQIELRVLAHVSGDKTLQESFRQGEDIHTRTAAEVFGVPPMMVDAEQRRRAKAVNFGIVYGLSPFGLANQLGIPQKEAKAYIEAYFELYPGVQKYMKRAVSEAKKTGYAQTIFGRKRPINDLSSRNPAARGFAERTAINSPIQGAAADLIKVAMLHVDEKLRAGAVEATMLLQVHDELLFEIPAGTEEAAASMVKSEMEQAEKLEVPLVVDVKSGPNWRDMKPV